MTAHQKLAIIESAVKNALSTVLVEGAQPTSEIGRIAHGSVPCALQDMFGTYSVDENISANQIKLLQDTACNLAELLVSF